MANQGVLTPVLISAWVDEVLWVLRQNIDNFDNWEAVEVASQTTHLLATTNGCYAVLSAPNGTQDDANGQEVAYRVQRRTK